MRRRIRYMLVKCNARSFRRMERFASESRPPDRTRAHAHATARARVVVCCRDGSSRLGMQASVRASAHTWKQSILTVR
eukprot:3663648-Pleurochrysis_carterae.AAC.3